MSNIAEKIEKFQAVKERIRQAIISKGVDVREGASLSGEKTCLIFYISMMLDSFFYFF